VRFDWVDFESWARVLLGIFSGLVLLYLVLPMLAIVPLSFNQAPYFTYPMPGLSLRWYAKFFGSTEWMLALRNSLIIAFGTMLLATVLGTLAALGLTLADFPLKSVVVGLLVSPLMVPHIIIGVGMFFFYAWLGVANTLGGMILAHATLATPFVVLTVAVTLANFNKNLMRAAAGMGANPVQVFGRVVLPLILPGVLSGALFAFIASFDELIVALLLAGSENRTLPRQMWSGVREEISPVVTAVATTLFVIATLLMIAMEALRRRSERLQATRFQANA
jgi:putative spermidine/putrescine transport system permease protein